MRGSEAAIPDAARGTRSRAQPSAKTQKFTGPAPEEDRSSRRARYPDAVPGPQLGERLPRLPGVLLACQREDLLGKLPGGDVGDGHALEHLAQVGAQRDPDLLEGLR